MGSQKNVELRMKMMNETHAEWLKRKEEKLRRQKELHNENFVSSSVADDEAGIPKLSEREVWEIIRPKKQKKKRGKS